MHLYPAGIATCDRRITKEDLYVCAKCVFGLKAIFKSQQLPVNGLFCSTFIICMQYHYCNNEPTQIIRQHSPRCPSISLPAEYSEIRSILLSFSWYEKIVFFWSYVAFGQILDGKGPAFTSASNENFIEPK